MSILLWPAASLMAFGYYASAYFSRMAQSPWRIPKIRQELVEVRYVKRKYVPSLLLSIAGFLMPASLRAQFLGYTSPQTVQQTIANTVTCTGAAQTFVVSNLGQTQHQATATVSAGTTSFTMQFIGFDAALNAFPISEIATIQTNAPFTNGVLQSVGYFPIVKVQVICLPVSATFTINYSGSSSSPIFDRSGYQVTQYDKSVFVGQTQTGASPVISLTSPTFNTSGTVDFEYIGAPSGALGSVTVLCQSQSDSSLFSKTFSLANATTHQLFSVPASPCPFPQISYSPPGTPNGTFLLEYIFNLLGGPIVTDPCQSPGIVKQSKVITAAATSTTQIVALSGNTTVYVCGYQGSMSAAGAYSWEYGTGASCGTGTTALTGVETTLSGTPIYDGGPGMIFQTAAGNALCIVTATAGAFNGKLTYVQQ